jgi:DNA-binding HxlR family transcriptional regulator
VRRFSELERLVTGISQKMLAQHLRQLEAEGLVLREVHAEVPPRVEYRLSDWGSSFARRWRGCLAGCSGGRSLKFRMS